jgi:hypothetical protein
LTLKKNNKQTAKFSTLNNDAGCSHFNFQPYAESLPN